MTDRASSGAPRPSRFSADFALLMLSVVTGCTPAESVDSAESVCTPFPSVVPRDRGLADLTDAVPFRTYVALTDVEPFSHHYLVSINGARGQFPMLAARLDASGSLQLTGGGDLGHIQPEPAPEARDVTRALERELTRRCPDARVQLQYAGGFRKLRATTFFLADVRAGSERIGRFSEFELLADATLENTVPWNYHDHDISIMSAFGLIRVPKHTRWVEVTRSEPFFNSDVLAAARNLDAGAPGPRLADLPLDEPDALLMNGYEPRIHLVVKFSSDPMRWDGQAVLPISVHDAVFGPKATSETVVTLGTTQYQVQATLVPAQRFAPTRERRQRAYRGNLSVRILDAHAVAFERSYVTSGEVILKGEEAAVLYAWYIPGATTPSWDEKLLHGKLRSATGETIEFRLGIELKEEAPK